MSNYKNKSLMKNYLYILEIYAEDVEKRTFYYKNIEKALADAELFETVKRCTLEQYELEESGEYRFKCLVCLKTRQMIKEKLGE